ncbi:MAG: hypothetical protein HC892_22370, partial [Saprospiraceae bacterium]|nr:hypothetical protein [Saprospiraceae bacterium]
MTTSNRITNLYRKYTRAAKRFEKLNKPQRKAQLLQCLLRYERQLQRLGVAASLSFSLLGFTPEATAQTYPFNKEFQVNTFTNSEQRNPSVAMDADGDFVTVWQSNGQDGNSYDIYGQRYNSDGTTAGAEFLVNTFTNNNQSAPSVAIEADGDFVVVWESYSQDGSGFGIYGQRYNSDGTTEGMEFLINTYTTNIQRNPSVAMDANGDFVVAWQSYGNNGYGYGIYGQRYNSDGTTEGGEFQVNTFTAY